MKYDFYAAVFVCYWSPAVHLNFWDLSQIKSSPIQYQPYQPMCALDSCCLPLAVFFRQVIGWLRVDPQCLPVAGRCSARTSVNALCTQCPHSQWCSVAGQLAKLMSLSVSCRLVQSGFEKLLSKADELYACVHTNYRFTRKACMQDDTVYKHDLGCHSSWDQVCLFLYRLVWFSPII